MTEQLPWNTSPLPLRLRVDDFLLLDDSGAFRDYRKTELIDGEIYFKNAQHRPHMMAKGELAFRLRLALEAMNSHLAVGIEGSYDYPTMIFRNPTSFSPASHMAKAPSHRARSR